MNIRKFLAVSILILGSAVTLNAQDLGYWRADSTNARAITGDIGISETSISINFTPFTIAHIRKLKTAEVAALFDVDVNSGAQGNLYRLSIPSERRFAHHNTLCGSESTQWMATFVSGRTLQITLFSGLDEPTLTFDALSNTTTRCATLTYSR